MSQIELLKSLVGQDEVKIKTDASASK